MSQTREQYRKRREGTAFARDGDKRTGSDALWIYGIHAVEAALGNPRRKVKRMLATANAIARLKEAGATLPATVEDTQPRMLDHLLGRDAVHQGVAIEVEPLKPLPLKAISGAKLVVVLDQITDPHNVGAILRSAVAFGSAAVITTGRHAAAEGGVLAKAASGALDRIMWIEVPNLARALEELKEFGFLLVGLDSEGSTELEGALAGRRIALVLGAEGKGLRRLTRDTCDVVAKLEVPGAITSLNVSNAAAVALYVVSRHIAAQPVPTA